LSSGKSVITALFYAGAVYAVIMCLSVCLSVTSWSPTKTAKPMITQTTPYDSPGTLVFQRQKSMRNSNGITPNGGARQGRLKSVIFYQYLAVSQKRCKIWT